MITNMKMFYMGNTSISHFLRKLEASNITCLSIIAIKTTPCVEFYKEMALELFKSERGIRRLCILYQRIKFEYSFSIIPYYQVIINIMPD